ncbi:ATP-binding protein [Candidatus Borrarchaeum sp.]|uniref:hybrid sensor histidine kinase/response regulator n=1 Tax=Candidatus Borrarchaeum sp. TaxID=2846742 RepID=UPI00257A9C2F|nr:ATP-binding protein [Candidatus Borrarchaeum sp.]
MEGNQLRVLLIEDNPGDARLIQEELAETDPLCHEITHFFLLHVDRLSQGLECLKNEKIDIVLLDLGLPDSLGLDTFTKLYAYSPQVPIIVLTGFDDENLAVKAVGEGAQDYLVKGKFDKNLLTRSICYAIERHRLISKLRDYAENLEKMVEERTMDLKESEERYRGLYESSIDGIATADMKGDLIDCNQAFAELLGYTKEELLKLTYWDLAPKKWHELTAKIHAEQVLTRGYSDVYEKEYMKKDGTIFPISIRSWIIKDKDGKSVGTWAIVQDITERYKIMEMKDRFISVATHELRTPLISVKGYIDFLLSKNLNVTPELLESSLQVVNRNTDRLIYLTDELLDIQRIKSGRISLNLEFQDLINIINHCIEEIQPFIDEKKQNLNLKIPERPLKIRVDRVRLSQIIMNILNNATKFTPEGGDITLAVEETDGVMQVQVSDNGIGIREEDLEKVFRPFSDIKKPTYIKGTGLGLSVTKGLVEAHGGRIWAHSDGEDRGAAFTFTLPNTESNPKPKVKEVN